MATRFLIAHHNDPRIREIWASYRSRLGWFFVISLSNHNQIYCLTKNSIGLEPMFSFMGLYTVPRTDFWQSDSKYILKIAEHLSCDKIIERINKFKNDNIQFTT